MHNSEEQKTILGKILDSLANDKLEESQTTEILSKENRKRIAKGLLDEKGDEAYFDSEKNEVLSSIVKDRNNKTSSKQIFWLLGTAACLVLFAAVTYFLTTQDPNQIHEPIMVDTKIEIGTDKATLTLQDGTDVLLEQGTSYQTTYANSDGKEIIYSSGLQGKSEVAYNYLEIPRGGQFKVQLADGTMVWLNSGSKLKYPVAFENGVDRNVELLYGEAYFDVSPSTEHGGSRFKVLHDSQEIEVLGTEFNIKAYPEESYILTTLVEGKVSLNIPEKDKVILEPNEQSQFNIGTSTIQTIEVDVYNETSWREGIFSFKAKTLSEIMTVLSRWYDVEIIFSNESLETLEFNGVLGKDEKITNLLTTFKEANFINAYDVNNKTILLK